MKKFLVLTLTAVMLLSFSGLGASAMSFTDLAEDHWAYSNVQTLVTDGTVSGYEDGSFRPNGTVTRAEFVKMLGAGSETRSANYMDVSASHWAYSYIMSASFPDDGTNMFFPDRPITRGLVAELLWNRGGKSEDAFAPSVITSQYKKQPAAAAWVYATGLMQGDDGVNLRLDDTLSRAEAAALIVRSRSIKSADTLFAETVSPAILENVYNGLKLFGDKAYDPNATITNGEMARAALRIGSEETNLSYYGLDTAADFEHTYALDVAAICKSCLGADKATAAFADKTATFGDSVAALVHQFITKSKKAVSYGATTEGLPAGTSNMANICLTFAKNNGIITLKEDLTAPITLRDFMAICICLDDVIGSQTDITSDINTFTGNYVKKNHSLALTEVPYGDYRVVLKDMPAALYNTPFIKQTSVPAESYNFAREYSSIFSSMLLYLQTSVEERSGASVRLTYYPSLVCNNGNGYSMRLACEILEADSTKTMRQLFAISGDMDGADTQLTEGSVVYFDLATGGTFTSVYATDETAYVEQIVLIQ